MKKLFTHSVLLLSITLLMPFEIKGQGPLRRDVPEGYVFVAAHRADWKYAPENSL